MESKKTMVIGASENPQRYSYLATEKLKLFGHEVVAIANKKGIINGTPIITERPLLTDIDTVTLYINPALQKAYYDYIISLQPKRIIFNPGTENEELYDLVKAHHIQAIEACTLVMLSTGQY